ncbi:hypothetical protein [Spirobacillus cienkowskii]|uniref:Uncharacterized protein n=1 Tax=Spirobacillus cienkowskii TaxID=495820 RepID=A0A369KRF4_9BACT|nr:MAG: hypothetical protein DCC88_06275 [Spirobacillus cienkowskii]
MFDKNDFKEKFRFWLEHNQHATYEEAKLFCDLHIPIHIKEQYSWLEEQSLSWFLWRKESQEKTIHSFENDEGYFEEN